MKVLLCLMATFAACNAGLLTGLLGASGSSSSGHGHGHVQIEIEPQHLHHVHNIEHIHHPPQVEHVEHVHHVPHVEHVEHLEQVHHVPQVQHVVEAPQQQVQIVKLNDVGSGGYAGGYGGGYAGGYSSAYAGGHSYSSGHSHGYSGASYLQPQIIKVIHEHAAPIAHEVTSGYATQGYSIGHGPSHVHTYAPSYSYQNSLEAILPQILQIILQDSGSSGSSYTANRVINAFGNKGRVIVTKGKGISPLRSGHVVEKGHIEVVKVERKTLQGKSGGSFSGIGQLFGGNGGRMGGKW